MPKVQANGQPVFKVDTTNGKLMYIGGVSGTPDKQRVFLEELDASEMEELDSVSNETTMYGQIVRHCNEID